MTLEGITPSRVGSFLLVFVWQSRDTFEPGYPVSSLKHASLTTGNCVGRGFLGEIFLEDPNWLWRKTLPEEGEHWGDGREVSLELFPLRGTWDI